MRTLYLKVRDTKPGSFETARITCSTLSGRVHRVQDVEDCIYCICKDNRLSGVVALFFRGFQWFENLFRTWGLSSVSRTRHDPHLRQ